jgi:hypothetical protein
MKTDDEIQREFLRHTIATLAYRAEKVVRDAPQDFSSFRIGNVTRPAGYILAHISDLLDWSLWLLQGKHVWHDSDPLPWEEERARLFDRLKALDEYLVGKEVVACDLEKLFQGPIADALTHVGQLAMLRRLAGAPIRGENYFKAEIVAGRVGPGQSEKRVEFS